VTLGLELAVFFRFLDGRHHGLVPTILWSLNHVTVVRGTDLSRHLLAPGVGLVVAAWTFYVGGVALRLEPGPAHSLLWCSVLFWEFIALLDQWSVTLLETVVEWDLLEVNLARLPEAFLTLLLLGGEELCDVGVVALRHVLVPALFHLVILHVVHIFHLCDAPGAIRSRSRA